MILRQATRDGWSLDVPGVVPKLSGTPGTLRSPAPRLGEDTDAVLRELGLGDVAIAALRAKGIVG
jgi:formyl-CoA transferase